MQNKLIDLNNHLFLAIERLNDDEITGDKLNEEIRRTESIAKAAEQIINNANTVLRACIAAESMVDSYDNLKLLTGEVKCTNLLTKK